MKVLEYGYKGYTGYLTVYDDGTCDEHVRQDNSGRLVHQADFPLSNLGGIGNAAAYLRTMTASIRDREVRNGHA